MRVVKKSQNQKGWWSGTLTCTGKGYDKKGCGAKLVISEQKNLVRDTRTASDGRSTEGFVYFVCPHCGVRTEANEDVPLCVWLGIGTPRNGS
jgi:hypothetical protein